jgi:hypothetical protein
MFSSTAPLFFVPTTSSHLRNRGLRGRGANMNNFPSMMLDQGIGLQKGKKNSSVQGE